MTEDCWLYAGPIDNYGYGAVSLDYKTYKAHRVMYEDAYGPVPEGLVIDHLCEVKLCVNPKHLEAVTQRENAQRWYANDPRRSLRTVCRQGHPLVEGNYSYWRGKRKCRTCALERGRRRYAEKRRKLSLG